MSVLGSMKSVIERVCNFRIVRPGYVALVFEQEHLRRFLQHFEVDCVFDVGANAGQYAKMLRSKVGYKGNIVSYEPIPELAEEIRSLTIADNMWFVEQLAIDDADGNATFSVLADSQFSSFHEASLVNAVQFRQETQVARRIRVRTATLADEFVKYRTRLGFKRPFLKMDTQGHDLVVARSAGSHLREFVGIQSELGIRPIYADAPTFGEALKFYNERGFELSAFVPNNYGHFPRLIEIDCIMFRS